MVKCQNCGNEVNEGKFCEKCGKPLVSMNNSSSNPHSMQNLKNNFFDKLNKGMGELVTSLNAIKSNFGDENVIYKVSKIPNIKEKKIVVNNNEIVYFSEGQLYSKYIDDFMTESDNFNCFYIKNYTQVTDNINFVIKPYIKNLSQKDIVNIQLIYNLSYEVIDVDSFFNILIDKKQDTWTKAELNGLLNNEIKTSISNKLIDIVNEDGGFYLKDGFNQIKKIDSPLNNLVKEAINKYKLKLNSLDLISVNSDINEVAKILIENLYKDM